MDEHATAEMSKKQTVKQEGPMATQINVTVTPGNPNGNAVPCQLHVAPPQYLVDGAIWLDPAQDYNIMFNIVAGNPRTWDVAGQPFCNMKGQCPAAAGGTQNGFNVTAKGPNAITVYVPAQGSRAVQHYRMNFDNGYSCDPIIVVGAQ